ncbi:MAG: hypothetical protein WBN75_09420, partial [Verrucomicrobiia bacterium]
GFPEYPDDLFFAVLAFSHSSAAFLFAAELSFCHVQFFGVRSRKSFLSDDRWSVFHGRCSN